MIPLYDINPRRTQPGVTKALITANVAVFLSEMLLFPGASSLISAGYGMVPARLSMDFPGEAFTVLTSMFLHGGFAHLAWNMLFLWIFGDNIEEKLGSRRFLAFYLLSGVAAAAAQYFVNPQSHLPMVGASGAIAGVLGAYIVEHPKAKIAVLNPFFPLWFLVGPLLMLPAWLVVGEWFLGNLMGALGSSAGDSGGVAFFAHLGGFLFGLLAIRLFHPASPGESHPSDFYSGWRGFRTEAQPAPVRPIFWREEKNRPFWK